jgi:VWFA-related protein
MTPGLRRHPSLGSRPDRPSGRSVAGLAVVVLCAIATLTAQQQQQTPPQQQTPVFRAGTDKVRIDVIVTHRGRPVEGLTAGDFELKDNGVVQAIESATTAGSVSVAIALDVSRAGDVFEELRQAALALADALQPDDEAWLVTFASTFQRRIGPTTDKAALRQIITSLRSAAGTAMWDALFGSVALVKGTEGRSLVVALTNGLDASSYLDEERTLEVLRRGEVVINAVRALRAFRESDYGGFVHLEAMTNATGGRIMGAERRDRMAQQFGNLLNEFRLGYVLTYAAKPSTRRDGWHDVNVRLKDKPGSVRARKGYYDAGR